MSTTTAAKLATHGLDAIVQKTVFLPQGLYLQIKARAILTQSTVGEALACAIEAYLKPNKTA